MTIAPGQAVGVVPGGFPTDDAELATFREFAATRSRALRNRLVEEHMGLAAHIAKRYARAGSGDDVRQVAMLGLVKAVDRFDPGRGTPFGSFAGRTIEGEVKRYFRDKTWSVQVPRSAKELHLAVRRATDELGHTLRRSPTVPELARHLGVDRDDVIRGLAATAAARPDSIDAPGPTDDEPPTRDRFAGLAAEEAGFDASLDKHIIGGLLQQLPEREREIVRLRFYEELSQSDIAERVGVSQMHVSRLLRRSFELMRSWADGDASS